MDETQCAVAETSPKGISAHNGRSNNTPTDGVGTATLNGYSHSPCDNTSTDEGNSDNTPNGESACQWALCGWDAPRPVGRKRKRAQWRLPCTRKWMTDKLRVAHLAGAMLRASFTWGRRKQKLAQWLLPCQPKWMFVAGGVPIPRQVHGAQTATQGAEAEVSTVAIAVPTEADAPRAAHGVTTPGGCARHWLRGPGGY